MNGRFHVQKLPTGAKQGQRETVPEGNPRGKHQIPNTKLQRNSKLQISKGAAIPPPWSLELGASLVFGVSLVFGALLLILRQQVAAAPANARLPQGLMPRGLRFFLQQRREHQQGARREPRQRRGCISRAPQQRIEIGTRVLVQQLPEQSLFELFEVGFLRGPKRDRRRLEQRTGRESPR